MAGISSPSGLQLDPPPSGVLVSPSPSFFDEPGASDCPGSGCTTTPPAPLVATATRDRFSKSDLPSLRTWPSLSSIVATQSASLERHRMSYRPGKRATLTLSPFRLRTSVSI